MNEDQKREDFATIEPGLNRAFENNKEISPEFKEIARACFGRIFYMLGENNFRRWIDMKQMNKQIKELIIESMSKEEMESNPSTMGYYSPTRNRIKLSSRYDTDTTKDTNVHETLHLVTNTGDKFCTFLNEGLTEYMKGMAINKPNSYEKNVRAVTFLHEIMGDSLIKAYLMGKGKFDEQFLNLVNYDNSSTIYDIKDFYSNLNLAHKYNSATTEKDAFDVIGATPEVLERADKRLEDAQNKYEHVKPQILLMYTKIIVGRISEMSKNMAFYKKGNNGIELDLKEASRGILDLMEKSNIKDFEVDYITMAKWRAETSKLAAEQVLENSHILVGYEGNERETRKQELIDKIAPQIIITKQTSEATPRIENSDITPEENSNMTQKLFEQRLSSNMNITQYIEIVSKIASTMNVSDAELGNLLTKYNIEYFGDVGNFKKINETIKKSIPKIQKLNELQEQRKKDTITSEYKQIGDGKFIEKRDNQIFLVELNEAGEFSEQEVKLSRETLFSKDGARTEIDFSKGLSNLEVKINGRPVELSKTVSLQEIKDMELADAFSKDIEKNIKSGKYTRILDDAENPFKTDGLAYTADIDKRSREIVFDQYISDLKSIIRLIPESQRTDLIKSKSEMLLDQVYRIPKERQPDVSMKRNEDVEYEYKRFSNAIVSSVGKDSVGRLDLGSIKRASEVLSNERRKVVEENSKSALIYFRTPKIKKEYENQKKSEAIRNRNKAVVEVPQSFDCSKFYEYEGEIPLDDMPYHLKGVSTTQRVDSRNVKFSYDNFAQSVKGLISKYPDSIHYDLFDKIFDKQMQETFLIPAGKEPAPEIADALDSVKNMLDNKISDDIEIDEEKINENLIILNNYRMEKVKEERKHLGVKFASKDAQDMFATFTDIIEIVKNSKIKTDEVTETVKGIMSAQMEKDNKKESDAPNLDD